MILLNRLALLGLFFILSLPGLSQSAKASLEGLVLDAATREPVAGANIQAFPGVGKPVSARSARPDGSFKLTLNARETYRIVVAAKGFLETVVQENFSDSRSVSILGKTIYLSRTPPVAKPVAENLAKKTTAPTPPSPAITPPKQPLTISLQPVELRAIQFAQSTAEMVPTAKIDLDRVLTFLQQNPAIVIEVAGHTDNQGDFDQNVLLSRQRAEAVKTYLVGQGIDPRRVQTRGYGGTRPVATNNYEPSRQLNRRVELRIVSQ